MTATAKKEPKNYIDLACVETGKANAQALTCVGAACTTAALAAISLAAGVLMPAFAGEVTACTVWTSMALEAAAGGLGALSTWIRRNAL